MAQEDYLTKQVDQLGLVLKRLLNDLLGRKDTDLLDSDIDTINQTLDNKLGLDIGALAGMPAGTVVNTLITRHGVGPDGLEKLADTLLFVADRRPGNNAGLYGRCLEIYEYLEQTDNTYVLDRHWKIARIKTMV